MCSLEALHPKINDYQIIKLIGQGASAKVYSATRQSTTQSVAIKLIDKSALFQSELVQKVTQEIALHQSLNHPNILSVYDTFKDDRNFYMILELCPRGSLADACKKTEFCVKKNLDRERLKAVFCHIVEGVRYLHEEARVIHRDLKLANVLLTDDYRAKISDFGLATSILDHHSTFCGTPNFLAPEILDSNDSYSEQVDIWSLGCMLHCLLLGKPPFEGKKVSETLRNISRVRQTPLALSDELPSGAADLIRRLLHPIASKRPTAREILRHAWLKPLDEAKSQFSLKNGTEDQYVTPKRPPRKSHTRCMTKKSRDKRRMRHRPFQLSSSDTVSGLCLAKDDQISELSFSQSEVVQAEIPDSSNKVDFSAHEMMEMKQIEDFVALQSSNSDGIGGELVSRIMIKAEIKDVPCLGIGMQGEDLCWTCFEDRMNGVALYVGSKISLVITRLHFATM
uniref:Protein kinase putative n=1 Tax=Albugo laibachii Nc14 TaxID=890382 RepID=F0X2H6_9STRA|nr:protein kinase putative [Albugo laibachii Nc14]|eukprot:CCA28075.1 protein kinase putative [Albugo laibachii Nc14]